MTSPVSHGYPDYGRFSARADKFIHSQANVVISAEQIYGPYFVGDVEYLGIRVFGQTNNVSVHAEFLDTPSASFFLSARAFEVNQNCTLDRTILVMGPYVQFRVSPSAANTQFTLRAWTSHASAAGDLSGAASPTLISFAQVIAAGGNFEADATRIWPGQALWSVSASVAAWIFELRTVGYTGTITNIAVHTRPAIDSDTFLVFLPAQQARIRVTNQAAGAGTFRGILVGRPIEPGA